MGLTQEQIREGLDFVAEREPRIGAALGIAGYPQPRLRPTGYKTLLRTIVGQQVSVAAATSMWNKLEAELGEDFTPSCLLARDNETLRACGLSRQKQGYARSLCELVDNGDLDLDGLPSDDEAAIEQLTRISGIGPKIADMLNDLGIVQIEQLAALNKDMAEMIDAQVPRGQDAVEDWIRQARKLSGFEKSNGMTKS